MLPGNTLIRCSTPLDAPVRSPVMPEGILSVVVLERLQVQDHLLADGQYHRWEGVAPSSRRHSIYVRLMAASTASKERQTPCRPRVWDAGEVKEGCIEPWPSLNKMVEIHFMLNRNPNPGRLGNFSRLNCNEEFLWATNHFVNSGASRKHYCD